MWEMSRELILMKSTIQDFILSIDGNHDSFYKLNEFTDLELGHVFALLCTGSWVMVSSCSAVRR